MLRKIVFYILLILFIIPCHVMAQKRVLVFTRNGEGYVHDNIAASVAAIKNLCRDNNFKVDISDVPTVFTEENLKQYDALIFSNTNNKVFDTDAQKLALMRYTEAGGGFVGIHSACATERDWFWQMVGGKNWIESWYTENKGENYIDVRVYQDYRELLKDKSIDAVIISTPDHWHAQLAIEAALAGKDVYLQKPASLTIQECRQMSDTFHRTGRILQVGSQQRSLDPLKLRTVHVGLSCKPYCYEIAKEIILEP